MTDQPKCEVCGEPMPPGEEMFNYHGYSGPCPKPPLPGPGDAIAHSGRAVMDDSHPEAYCEECGCRNVTWFAPSPIWNAVVRTSTPEPDPMLCPTCFIRRAETDGYDKSAWMVSPERISMGLFQTGDFTLNSGRKSGWKIECDSLAEDDWAALALMASEILPPFRMAIGVPRGGMPFATALNHYATHGPVLIAEDVVTTGGSMIRFREETLKTDTPTIGVCVFARWRCPSWVTPLFMTPMAARPMTVEEAQREMKTWKMSDEEAARLLQ